jgi:hypothetical protein
MRTPVWVPFPMAVSALVIFSFSGSATKWELNIENP